MYQAPPSLYTCGIPELPVLAQPSESYFQSPSDHFRLPGLWYGSSSTLLQDAPKGFLFLCYDHFQTRPSSFKWPDCPAYWSFDPTGAERLSREDAIDLRFPCLKLSIWVQGRSWYSSVYAGLRQFHQGKGFDPDSQEVARHLGEPLYRLPREIFGSFARRKLATVPNRNRPTAADKHE
ncbi:hypothetical protein B0H19DRAFT_1068430 [Mycena capillaripes]|nr:hypothetical protein B0H19DRAFT_1068430 [Mycena capillaripes]